MLENLLVTTSLEQTWKTKNKIIFLGKWCNRHNNINKLDKDRYKILDYHWNDRQKLVEDYRYLNGLNSKLLQKLTAELNKFHNTSFSERYWRIIIGPWLITFIQIVFERYENLNNLFKKEKISETIIAKINASQMIPDNFENFSRLTLTHTWNHYIYSLILDFENFKFNINKKYETFINEEKYNDYLRPKKISKISKIYEFFVKIFNKFKRHEDVLISESYLGLVNEIRLCIKLRTMPRFETAFEIPNSNISKNRNKIFLKNDCDNVFEEFICNLIPTQLPKSFIEDFNQIKIKSEAMCWPKKPKIIFTSHFMQKTLQSRYVAEKVENFGTKLIHGQHGGAYGQYLFTSMQDYELNICDKYLSWGWSLPNKEKVIPFGILKNVNKIKYNKTSSKNLLMVLRSQPLYTHKLNSYSGTNQVAKYFEDNINLCKKLDNDKIKDNLILRLHARKFGWNEDAMFKYQIPKIKIDNGYSKMPDLLKKSKLVLQTYIGTGYLESITSNFPTILFANLNECLINDETKEYLKILKKVNIFHDNYSSAAEFINKNWENIDNWWNKEETQKARIIFCNKFAKKNKNMIDKLYKIIDEQKKLLIN